MTAGTDVAEGAQLNGDKFKKTLFFSLLNFINIQD